MWVQDLQDPTKAKKSPHQRKVSTSEKIKSPNQRKNLRLLS